jgi:hypothetical protein
VGFCPSEYLADRPHLNPIKNHPVKSHRVAKVQGGSALKRARKRGIAKGGDALPL